MDTSELIYKVNELQSEGLCCAQIAVKLLTEDYSLYENDMLIEAMSALGYGFLRRVNRLRLRPSRMQRRKALY